MDKSLRRIELLNYIFGALFILVAFGTSTMQFTFSVAFGVLVTSMNFTLLRFLVEKMMRTKNSNAAYAFLPKMLGLLTGIAASLYFLPISPVGMGIGFSVFILSIVIEGIRFVGGGGDGENSVAE